MDKEMKTVKTLVIFTLIVSLLTLYMVHDRAKVSVESNVSDAKGTFDIQLRDDQGSPNDIQIIYGNGDIDN